MQDHSLGNQTLAAPERAAIGAALTGFAMSFVLLLTYGPTALLESGAARGQFPIESVFAFLWPSSLLLLGGHTLQGKIVLFLLSAFLNAGYYTFAALLAYALVEKFQTRTVARVATVSAEARLHPAAGIAERMTATRPIA